MESTFFPASGFPLCHFFQHRWLYNCMCGLEFRLAQKRMGIACEFCRDQNRGSERLVFLAHAQAFEAARVSPPAPQSTISTYLRCPLALEVAFFFFGQFFQDGFPGVGRVFQLFFRKRHDWRSEADSLEAAEPSAISVGPPWKCEARLTHVDLVSAVCAITAKGGWYPYPWGVIGLIHVLPEIN